MSYEKQNFVSGQILTADAMNHIEGGISDLHTPQLTSTQRQNIVSLVNDWYNVKTSTSYSGGVTRNNIVNRANCIDDSGKLMINCNLLAQLIWAGIHPDSFLAADAPLDGTLIKSFDWGYWFKFWRHCAYGLKKSDGKPYGYVQPTSGSVVHSFGNNSVYSEDNGDQYGQLYLTFMRAADMAHELYMMGCEIKPSELMTGDLVFFEATRLDDNVSDDIEKSGFRQIGHVAVVSNANYLNSHGDVTFFESCEYYAGGAIGTCKLMASDSARITRAASIQGRMVMCARHPAAFGIAGNVPDVATEI